MFFSDYFDSANLCGSHRNIVLNIFLDNTEYFIIHLTKNSSSVCLMESWEHRLEGRFFFSLIQSWVVPQLGKASFVWVLKSTKGGDFHHLSGYLDQCCITILVKKFSYQEIWISQGAAWDCYRYNLTSNWNFSFAVFDGKHPSSQRRLLLR